MRWRKEEESHLARGAHFGMWVPLDMWRHVGENRPLNHRGE
jgi:hypothetical protein